MSKTEIRGIWLTNTDSQVLSSQSNIAQAMNFLADTGFNVVFPVVWNKAATLYPSKVIQGYFGFNFESNSDIDPLYQGRDPLAELVTEGHRVGMKVIPWFEYGFASSYNSNGGRLLAKKPEWSARDRSGNLLKKNGFEWLNALDPRVQSFLQELVLEVAQNYDIDGIQGDDRLPAFPCEGGYDEKTKGRYYQQFGKNPPNNPKDKQWLQWRADILTEFWGKLYREVKAVNPNLIVSLAPSIPKWGFQEYLQDCDTWLQTGLVDIIHPQIYRRDFSSYKKIIDNLLKDEFSDPIYPNRNPCKNSSRNLLKLAPGILMKIGSYVISPDYLIKAVNYNRDRSINGEVFFFYEGLRANNNQLANILRSQLYCESASFPTPEDLRKDLREVLPFDNKSNHKNRFGRWWNKVKF